MRAGARAAAGSWRVLNAVNQVQAYGDHGATVGYRWKETYVDRDLIAALSPSDRTWPIFARKAGVPGFRLVCYDAPVEEIFLDQISSARFDVAELSLASYLIAVGRGETQLTAIPVFLSRAFRHNAIFVRADSPLQRLSDLRHVRFGFPEFQMTAAVWVRALLREAGGIAPDEIEWVTYRPERVPVAVPVRHGRAPDIFQGLISGEVDAIMSARRPPHDYFPATGVPGLVRRLLPTPWHDEREYYQQTGMFPIMHLVSLRREVVEQWPELPLALYQLFADVKADAVRRLGETVTTAVASPWLIEGVEATAAVTGNDVWPYGLARNWSQIEQFMRYLISDGLLDRVLSPADVFASAVSNT